MSYTGQRLAGGNSGTVQAGSLYGNSQRPQQAPAPSNPSQAQSPYNNAPSQRAIDQLLGGQPRDNTVSFTNPYGQNRIQQQQAFAARNHSPGGHGANRQQVRQAHAPQSQPQMGMPR